MSDQFICVPVHAKNVVASLTLVSHWLGHDHINLSTLVSSHLCIHLCTHRPIFRLAPQTNGAWYQNWLMPSNQVAPVAILILWKPRSWGRRRKRVTNFVRGCSIRMREVLCPAFTEYNSGRCDAIPSAQVAEGYECITVESPTTWATVQRCSDPQYYCKNVREMAIETISRNTDWSNGCKHTLSSRQNHWPHWFNADL